jgi:hypothetical protein
MKPCNLVSSNSHYTHKMIGELYAKTHCMLDRFHRRSNDRHHETAYAIPVISGEAI